MVRDDFQRCMSCNVADCTTYILLQRGHSWQISCVLSAADLPATERTQGNRVDFVEPQRNKRQSTPLPATREAAITAPVGARAIIKNGTVNTTCGPGASTTHNNVGPDAMTWASTCEMMNRTLEAFATRNTDSSDRGSNKSRKTFKKPKEFKDDSDGCIDTWVEVMRLHLEQDNLNDERQACTAILSNLEGTAFEMRGCKERRGTRHSGQNL